MAPSRQVPLRLPLVTTSQSERTRAGRASKPPRKGTKNGQCLRSAEHRLGSSPRTHASQPLNEPWQTINRVKRLMKPFMIDRAAVRPRIEQTYGRPTGQAISKHAVEMWRCRLESVGNGFREMSTIAHKRHAELNPDFASMPTHSDRVNRHAS
ncbi:hypothetical protein HK105_201210 [Polyrhizophydium stewartii]|uniref:Uncharacterized protein n=1 Tax=Polyrhizophydium stewartii TaxID=2732419 RepID=A0ABR4NHF0_9FUNG